MELIGSGWMDRANFILSFGVRKAQKCVCISTQWTRKRFLWLTSRMGAAELTQILLQNILLFFSRQIVQLIIMLVTETGA